MKTKVRKYTRKVWGRRRPVRKHRRKIKKVKKKMAWNIDEAKNRFSKAELRDIPPREFLDEALPKLSIDEKGRRVYGFEGRDLTPKEEEEFLSRPSIKQGDEWGAGTLDELGDLIVSDDVQVEVPFLIGADSSFPEHEGRHRAKAAELKGEETIPVLFVDKV